MKEFALPDVGEGLTEAEVVQWLVAVGDEVAQDQVIVEIETAKSLVELPSPFAGTVVALLASEGDVVRVGSALVRIDQGAEFEFTPSGDHDEGTVGEPVLVGYGTKAGPKRTRHIRRPDGVSRESDPPRQPASSAGSRFLAKPPVRLLAKQRGVNLRDVMPGGKSPYITRDDILRTAELHAVPTSLVEAADGDIHRPIRGVLKATADAVTRSAFTAPHASLSLSVDLTRALKVVAELRQDPAWSGSRPSVLLLVAKAFMLAIAENPDINSSWDDGLQQVHIMRSINLGIAAATPRGLIVPNIKNAQSLLLKDLAASMAALVGEAKAGTTAMADMVGGTVTITNIGSLGVDSGSPILNPGEAAILAFGASTPRPWVVGKRIRIREVATFTLAFDHRLVNGDLGARVLTSMARILTHPKRLWRYV